MANPVPFESRLKGAAGLLFARLPGDDKNVVTPKCNLCFLFPARNSLDVDGTSSTLIGAVHRPAGSGCRDQLLC